MLPNHAKLRVHHFRAEKAGPNLAQYAHSRTRFQQGHLAGIEVQETEVEASRVAIAHLDDQLPAWPVLNLAMFHQAFDLHGVAHSGVPQGRDPGLVFVTQRQMQDQCIRVGVAQLVGDLFSGHGHEVSTSRIPVQAGIQVVHLIRSFIGLL